MAVKAERVGTKSIWQRFLSLVLVGIVPLLFAIVLLGGILQLVFKVPVWSAATSMMGLSKIAAGASPLQLAKERTLAVEKKVQSLQAQNLQLQNQLETARSQLQIMQSKLSTSSMATTTAGLNEAAAKQEAGVLSTMDPSQAALVMAKLTTEQDAEAVAQMDAATSGPILAAMDPKLAGQVLTLAANLTKATTTATNASTSNQTPS